MKKFLSLLPTLFCFLSLSSQEFLNAFTFEPLDRLYVLSDNQGFLYAVGTVPATEHTYVKIKKFDPSGGTLVWEKTLFSNWSLSYQKPVIVENKIFIGGSFTSIVCEDYHCLWSAGTDLQADIYLAVIDLNGNVTLHREGGPGNEQVHGFAADQSGHLYFAGGFRGAASLGSRTYSSDSGTAPFLIERDERMNEILTLAGAAREPSAWFRTVAIYDNNLYCEIAGDCVLESGDSLTAEIAELYRGENGAGRLDAVIRPYPKTARMLNIYLFSDAGKNSYYLSNTYGGRTSGPQTITRINGENKIDWQKDGPSYGYMHPGTRIGKSFYSVVTRDVPSAGSGASHCIVRGNMEDGSTREVCNFNLLNDTRHIPDMALGAYGPNRILLSGTYDGTLQLSRFSLKNVSAARQSFIAIAETPAVTETDEEEDGEAGFVLYPNPASTSMVLRRQSNEPARLTITDMLGRIVLQRDLGTGENEVDVAFLTSGLYTAGLQSGAGTDIQKVVIRRE